MCRAYFTREFGVCKLLLFVGFAVFVGAFGGFGFFYHKRVAGLAFLARGLVPQGKVAFRVSVAAVKYFFAFGAFGGKLAFAAFGAGDVDIVFFQRGCVFAFGKARARVKLAVPAKANKQGFSALRALFVGFFCRYFLFGNFFFF